MCTALADAAVPAREQVAVRMPTFLVGLQRVRLAGHQDEQGVGHVHDGRLLEEGP